MVMVMMMMMMSTMIEGKELEFSLATLHCQSIGSLYIDSFRREPVQGLLVRYWPTLLDIAIYWINL